MNKILIKNGHVLDSTQKLSAKKDLLIENGLIAAIEDKIENVGNDVLEIDAAGKYVSAGFVELHCHLREPGFEYKETIETGTASAVSGGFTTICCMANTSPVNDNASVTDFILKQAKEFGYCKVLPIGAITKGLKGEELASIAELKSSGCIAISDDGLTVQNAKLMRTAMEYAKSFDLPVTTHSLDADLAKCGCMNESFVSTKLGLKGSPSVAEDVIISRDIMLSEVTGAHLHVGHLSTKGGIEMVKQAKAKGLNVTCEVTPHHFTLTDADIQDYDTNFKMCPPLREQEDLDAILQAFKEGGIIDAIATDHAPHGVVDKEVEFDHASFGIIGFETAFSLSYELVKKDVFSLEEMIRLLTARPAEVFGIDSGTLQIGKKADVTIFDTNVDWDFTTNEVFSKSKNSPFLNRKLSGKIEKTIVDGKLVFDNGELKK